MTVPSVTHALAKAEPSDEQCDEVDGAIELLERVDLYGLHSPAMVTDFSRVIIEFGELRDLADAHVVHTAK